MTEENKGSKDGEGAKKRKQKWTEVGGTDARRQGGREWERHG